MNNSPYKILDWKSCRHAYSSSKLFAYQVIICDVNTKTNDFIWEKFLLRLTSTRQVSVCIYLSENCCYSQKMFVCSGFIWGFIPARSIFTLLSFDTVT